MNRNFVYNPFIFIAGGKSLLIGVLGLVLTSFLAYFTGTHFNGLFNIDFAKDSDYWFFLTENISHWIILSVFLIISALLFSKSKVRIIDVFGTILLSRIPLLITPVIRTVPVFQSFMIYSFEMYLILGIYIISLIWSIVLMFNAYKVSCNLKNEKLFVSFVISILLTEVITKIIIYAIT